MLQRLSVNDFKWIEEKSQYKKDFIKSIMKIIIQNILLKIMFNILKNSMKLIMIYPFPWKKEK